MIGPPASPFPRHRWLAALTLLLWPGQGRADDARGSVYYPDGGPSGSARLGLGASLDVLPTRTVEAELRQVPRAVARARVGLPSGLFVDAGFAGNVLSNQIDLGEGWAVAHGSTRFALHFGASFWFGRVGLSGFDTTAWGLFSRPGASLGFEGESGSRTTVGLEALVGHARHVVVGSLSVEQRRLSFEGLAAHLTREIPFGRGDVYVGLSLLWARADYQVWLAFSDSEARQVFPRFHAGYSFLRGERPARALALGGLVRASEA